MNDSELRELLTKMHPASFAWAVVCCRGDRDLGEEVLQAVYVSLLEKPSTFSGRSSFQTWLFAVIRNTARVYRRGRWWSRAVRLDLATQVQTAENSCAAGMELAAAEDAKSVRRALATLPQRQHELIHLVFYEELSIAKAARVMNISVGTARRHYARAKSNLKKQLFDFGDPVTEDVLRAKNWKADARLV